MIASKQLLHFESDPLEDMSSPVYSLPIHQNASKQCNQIQIKHKHFHYWWGLPFLPSIRIRDKRRVSEESCQSDSRQHNPNNNSYHKTHKQSGHTSRPLFLNSHLSITELDFCFIKSINWTILQSFAWQLNELDTISFIFPDLYYKNLSQPSNYFNVIYVIINILVFKEYIL